eukprot:Lankesteria_metandrocarpae@DN3892_c1_g1_i1.p1
MSAGTRSIMDNTRSIVDVGSGEVSISVPIEFPRRRQHCATPRNIFICRDSMTVSTRQVVVDRTPANLGQDTTHTGSPVQHNKSRTATTGRAWLSATTATTAGSSSKYHPRKRRVQRQKYASTEAPNSNHSNTVTTPLLELDTYEADRYVRAVVSPSNHCDPTPCTAAWLVDGAVAEPTDSTQLSVPATTGHSVTSNINAPPATLGCTGGSLTSNSIGTAVSGFMSARRRGSSGTTSAVNGAVGCATTHLHNNTTGNAAVHTGTTIAAAVTNNSAQPLVAATGCNAGSSNGKSIVGLQRQNSSTCTTATVYTAAPVAGQPVVAGAGGSSSTGGLGLAVGGGGSSSAGVALGLRRQPTAPASLMMHQNSFGPTSGVTAMCNSNNMFPSLSSAVCTTASLTSTAPTANNNITLAGNNGKSHSHSKLLYHHQSTNTASASCSNNSTNNYNHSNSGSLLLNNPTSSSSSNSRTTTAGFSLTRRSNGVRAFKTGSYSNSRTPDSSLTKGLTATGIATGTGTGSNNADTARRYKATSGTGAGLRTQNGTQSRDK